MAGCPILLENGDNLLLEDGSNLLDEGSGGWLKLESGDYILQESSYKIILEIGTPCTASTTTVTVIVFTPMFLGKRRAVGHHQRGTRRGITTLSTPRVGS